MEHGHVLPCRAEVVALIHCDIATWKIGGPVDAWPGEEDAAPACEHAILHARRQAQYAEGLLS